MKQITVLGFDCPACRKTYARIGELIALHQAEATVEKRDDPRELMLHRVMKPPGIVVDGHLVHAGGVPTRRQIEKWLMLSGPAES